MKIAVPPPRYNGEAAIGRHERMQGRGAVVVRTRADFDVMGYRYAASAPLLSRSFDVETPYVAGSLGLVSKLSTYADGWRILSAIVALHRIDRSLIFFGFIAAASLAITIVLAVPLAVISAATEPVPRFPLAILVTGLGIFRLAYLSHPAPGA